MTREAFIFDAVRTPRGRGRKDGSLHEVKPVDLLSAMFGALQERNKLDTELVEEAVVGVVNPHGEQGSVIPRSASLLKGWSEKTTGLQVNRFCASGLEAINIVAAKVVAGQLDLGVAGGVEMMSRVPMGSDGGPGPRISKPVFRRTSSLKVSPPTSSPLSMAGPVSRPTASPGAPTDWRPKPLSKAISRNPLFPSRTAMACRCWPRMSSSGKAQTYRRWAT